MDEYNIADLRTEGELYIGLYTIRFDEDRNIIIFLDDEMIAYLGINSSNLSYILIQYKSFRFFIKKSQTSICYNYKSNKVNYGDSIYINSNYRFKFQQTINIDYLDNIYSLYKLMTYKVDFLLQYEYDPNIKIHTEEMDYYYLCPISFHENGYRNNNFKLNQTEIVLNVKDKSNITDYDKSATNIASQLIDILVNAKPIQMKSANSAINI